MLAKAGERVRLIIAGKVKRGSEDYWNTAERMIAELGLSELVAQTVRFIPDDQVEPYFTAADAVVIPYVDIFQSGVPFLAFSFGLPVIATDVGSLREDVTHESGLLCRPKDPADLARAITDFYRSGRYWASSEVRTRIRRVAEHRHSWVTVSEQTKAVYSNLLPARGSLAFTTSNSQPPQEAPSKCQE